MPCLMTCSRNLLRRNTCHGWGWCGRISLDGKGRGGAGFGVNRRRSSVAVSVTTSPGARAPGR